MPITHYFINVAFKGQHDFTVEVSQRAGGDTNIGTALFVKRSLQKSLGPGYTVDLTCIETTTTRTSC